MAAKRYSFVFYVALVVALAATYGVYRVIESTKASNRVATTAVVVAARDIAEGEAIDRLALSIAQWPVSTVPVGAYGRVDSVAGRVARVPIFSGEPLVPGRLAPEGTAAGLETKITPGKRAMAVRINDVSGMSGMIPPNSRVDIILTTTPVGTSEPISKIFMSNMRVLAVGPTTIRSEDGRPIPATVATIEFTPEEAEKLTVAQSQGSIQLALRGYGDPDSVVTQGATRSDVSRDLRSAPVRPPVRRTTSAPLRRPAPVAPETVVVERPVLLPPPPKPETTRVEIIRGGQRTEVRLPKDSVRRDTIPKN
jgi:pilus assembly protein CpaB